MVDVIEREGLLDHARSLGDWFAQRVTELEVEGVTGVRGRGLLLAIELREPVAAEFVTAARAAGFIVNAVAATSIRLAPPLIISQDELASFLDAIPSILKEISA